MINAKTMFGAWVIWILISGYYLSEENFGISITIGAIVFLALYNILKNDPQPILNKLPEGQKDENQDIDFSNLPGYVQPKERRPIPREDRPRNPKNL